LSAPIVSLAVRRRSRDGRSAPTLRNEKPLNLLILGATGPTGSQVVEQALQAGDRVTALVRTPEKLGDVADKITVVQGDATVNDDVCAAMEHQDAVISALGAGNSVVSDVYPRAASAVIRAAQLNGVSKLVWLSSHGVGSTIASATLMQKLVYRTMLRAVYTQKRIADEDIRSSGLQWTLVFPVRLTNGPATGHYRVGEDLALSGFPTISRADVADFMLGAARTAEWVGRSPILSH
jgi:putative NADH-flavin reductase